MVACIDMAFSVILSPSSYPCFFSKPASFLSSNTRLLGLGPGLGLSFEFQKNGRRILRRQLKFVISAQLSKSFSFTFGLDSPVWYFSILCNA
jgi:hypothetical protein